MGEDSAGEYRFRICKAKGCNNGTTLIGGVCSVCRREHETQGALLHTLGRPDGVLRPGDTA